MRKQCHLLIIYLSRSFWSIDTPIYLIIFMNVKLVMNRDVHFCYFHAADWSKPTQAALLLLLFPLDTIPYHVALHSV